jgi:hypothetical protein
MDLRILVLADHPLVGQHLIGRQWLQIQAQMHYNNG